jgi:hypothetical protein
MATAATRGKSLNLNSYVLSQITIVFFFRNINSETLSPDGLYAPGPSAPDLTQ